MKFYIKTILASFVLVFTTASCVEQLDVELENQIDADKAITKVDDLQGALLGAYSTLTSNGLYRESMLWVPDLLADNLRIGNSNGGSLRTEANWQYTPSSNIGTWNAAYSLIYRSNIVITNAERFADSNKKNRFVGQALALRALAHFDLLRYYAVDYDRNSTNLGVPIVLSNELNNPSRNTVKEVYDQIFADLTDAKSMLQNVDKDPQATGPYYFNETAVNALLARVSLYAKEWEDAVTYATLAIDNSADLSTGSEYAKMWSDDVKAEVIFAVAFATKNDGRVGSDLLDNTDPTTPKSIFTLSYDMANLYDATNDIRYDAFVLINPTNLPGANPSNDDVYLPYKYPGRGGERGLNNAKVLRVSEMYLIRAEAYANIPGNDNLGMADLNKLRSKRITSYTNENLAGASLKNAIQVERRKELVAEGHRWFDIRRTNSDITRGPDCRGLTINCTLNAGNFRFAYPIPQDEIFANNNIEQNPNY